MHELYYGLARDGGGEWGVEPVWEVTVGWVGGRCKRVQLEHTKVRT